MIALRVTKLAMPVLALFSVGAFAQEEKQAPNYNYVSLEYVYGVNDVDSDVFPDGSTDGSWYYGEGGQLDASFALLDRYLLRGSYYDASGEYRGGPDVDFTSGLVGVGIILPTDDGTGIDLSVEYRSDEVEFDGDDQSIEGIGFSFGVRSNVAERHELSFRVSGYMNDFDQAVGIKLGYAWNFTDLIGLTAGYEYLDVGQDDDDDPNYELSKFLVGARVYF